MISTNHAKNLYRQDLSDDAECVARLVSLSTQLVVVVATGDAEGEQHDRAALGLRYDQLQLVQAVRSALPSASMVLVVVSGGAVSTEQAESLVQATVWSGKAGMQAGAGFASLLYGDTDFSGRVAATVYVCMHPTVVVQSSCRLTFESFFLVWFMPEISL